MIMECFKIIILLGCVTAIHMQTLTGPSDTSVVRGEDGTLSCSVTGVTSPSFIWTATSVAPFVTIYSGGTKFTADTKYDNFGLSEPGDDSSSLTITDAAVEDEGSYTCGAQIVGNSDPASFAVDVKGTLAGVAGLPSGLVVDQEYTAQCIVTGSRPQVAIEWFISNNPQTTGISETSAVNPSNANLSDTTSDFTFTARKGLNAAVLACRVTGYRALSLQNQIQENTTTLNVNYPPTSVTVEFNAGGTEVSCVVDDANPSSVKYYIYKNDSLIPEGSTGSITIPTPGATDKFTCVAGNYLGNVTNDGYYTPPSGTTVPPTTTAGVSAAAVAGGICGALFVIILVVVLVFLWKKGKFENCGSSDDSNKVSTEKSAPQAAPRKIEHTTDNLGGDEYAMVSKPPAARGNSADYADGGQNGKGQPDTGMHYADIDLSKGAGHTEQRVPQNPNDVVVYSSILV